MGTSLFEFVSARSLVYPIPGIPTREVGYTPLKQAVADTGKSVNAAAKESGVPQAVLQRFVTGRRGITLETVERLCAYLQLELRPA
jgi:DNA-binding Xre family transcriptional regulator